MFSGNDSNYLISCNAGGRRPHDQPGQLPASAEAFKALFEPANMATYARPSRKRRPAPSWA